MSRSDRGSSQKGAAPGRGAPASGLSSLDRELLRAALATGLALEASFSSAASEAPKLAEKFRGALESCATADSPLVVKLAELAPKVSFALGPKHLMGLLVPLERLSGRSARDEEFLFEERDGTSLATSASDASVEVSVTPPLASRGSRLVLCENIRSAFNVGAIFRTAEAFGGSEVWLGGYTPTPQKTAMGTDALVKSRHFDRASDAIAEAKAHGYKIVALENAPGANAVENFTWPEKTLLVLGNERFGIDSQTLEAADHVVRISTFGQKNSMNVGIAFGVAASHWHRSPTAHAAHPGRDESAIPTAAGIHSLSPIGYLRGGYQNPQVAPRQGAYASKDSAGVSVTATIELEARFEGRPSNFEQALKDLEGFERAWILFGFHESHAWHPQVRPPRGDGTKRGLFATRAPHRPNRLGLSCVRIHKVTETKRRIEISEHDLLEGTPIYDIKPYVAGADAFPNAKSGWVDAIQTSAYAICESPVAGEKIDWLETQGETRLRDFIHEQLRYQPLDEAKKRLEAEGSGDTVRIGPHHTISFRTWRIDFTLSEKPRALEVRDIRSGYSEAELRDEPDVYLDKKLHHFFKQTFENA